MGFTASVVVDNRKISVRCDRLTRRQLRAIDRVDGVWQRSEQILRWACSGHCFDLYPAGVVLSIAQAIVNASLIDDPSVVYQSEIQKANEDPEWVRNILICTAFPQYRFSDLEDMTWEDWTKLSACADYKLLVFHGMSEQDLARLLEPQRAAAVDRDAQFEQNRKMMEMVAGTAAVDQGPNLFDYIDPDIVREMRDQYELPDSASSSKATPLHGRPRRYY